MQSYWILNSFQALGPTYSKLIANQFARLRKGDRFFYEDDTDQRVKLQPAELREIKKTTLALIFCNNLNPNNEPLGNYSLFLALFFHFWPTTHLSFTD